MAEAKQEAGFRVTFSVCIRVRDRVRVRGLSQIGGSVKILIRNGATVRGFSEIRVRVRVRNEDSIRFRVWGAVPEEPTAPEVA